ncbi:hypothetical protein AAFN60_08920 [Roseibacillus persicicus]|uniref:hypothetical protein n=1 Tax=Roseibacillus persicicus TaxID=454148 RepID=UPI00398A50EC
MTEKLTLWEPTAAEIIPASATTFGQITQCAVQLSKKDQGQIARALEAEDYEMGVNYLWIKSMAALKRELGTLGVEFLAEMLGRTDVDEDDDVQDLLSEKDALRLAEELGMISSTEALRLRQTQELISHFAKNEFGDPGYSAEEMDEVEAARALKACIKNIVGKPHIEVAHRFVTFREDLLKKQLSDDDGTIDLIRASPYFFRKLTISILLSAIKGSTGASLEIALGNLNAALPHLWDTVRETEKWQVGHTYSEVYAAGNSSATQGVKKALLKVRGFDFVPENLRSDTFAKAAQEILRAHDGMNNFYTEGPAVRAFEKLGTIIPAPALAPCTTALLSVILGNFYGTSHAAEPVARAILKKYSVDRWEYYLNQVLPGDIRILNKLDDPKPRNNWKSLANDCDFDLLNLKDTTVRKLVDASIEEDDSKLQRAQATLLRKYYGKRAK